MSRPTAMAWERDADGDMLRRSVDRDGDFGMVGWVAERIAGGYGWSLWANADDCASVASGCADDEPSAMLACDDAARLNASRLDWRLPDEAASTTPPCPHARPDWRMCPHCLGLNQRAASSGTVTWSEPSVPAPVALDPVAVARAALNETITLARGVAVGAREDAKTATGVFKAAAEGAAEAAELVVARLEGIDPAAIVAAMRKGE